MQQTNDWFNSTELDIDTYLKSSETLDCLELCWQWGPEENVYTCEKTENMEGHCVLTV